MNCLHSNKPAPDGICSCVVCEATRAVAPVVALLQRDVGPVDVPKTKCECVDCVLPPGHAPRAYPLVLFCPKCGMQHVDEAEFATKLHRKHRCVDRVVLGDVSELAAGQAPSYTTLPGCGYEWQPANRRAKKREREWLKQAERQQKLRSLESDVLNAALSFDAEGASYWLIAQDHQPKAKALHRACVALRRNRK